jgi:hypothetical protein
MDIAFVKYSHSKRYKDANAGMTCMLVAIEIATRYAYVVPMEGKSIPEVKRAFEAMWQSAVEEDGLEMNTITTDDGSEFTNHSWDELLSVRGVKQYIKEPGDRFSLGVIDRFTRTLKTWLEDWQIEHESLSWTDALPEVIERYNEHKVRTLGHSPEELRADRSLVREARSEAQQRGRQAVDRFRRLRVGDKVRIRLEPHDQPRARSRLAHPGRRTTKGVQRWSNQVYTIKAVEGYSFTLVDSQDQPAARTYRQHELMQVPATSIDVPDLFARVAHEDRVARRRLKEGLDD